MKKKPLYKDRTRELRIALVGDSQYFNTSTISNFEDITASISNGDTLAIYTKTKVFGIFGFGDNQTIAHLVKHPKNQVLIDFARTQQSNASIVFLPA